MYRFLAIPYAQPPVGTLRFAKPKPIITPSHNTIDATQPGNSCIQLYNPNVGNITQSEDCLVLNIWTKFVTNDKCLKKPVMVWIHGGSLSIGSIFQTTLPYFNGTAFNGAALASKDVVVVTINYRLGFFGFLYGGIERPSAPGNLGLYDQRLALKWVKANIDKFGGDPNKITVFGQSAGSASIAAHIISPLSKGLFQRAITESGSLFVNYDYTLLSPAYASSLSTSLANSLNCFNTTNWLKCLRSRPVSEFLPYLPTFTLPTVRTKFLPLYAQEAFASGNYTKGLDIIAGNTRDEGAVPVASNTAAADYISYSEYLLTLLLNIVMPSPIVEGFYFNPNNTNLTDPTALKLAYYGILGDPFLTCPTYFFAENYAWQNPNNNVYYYQWNYGSSELINLYSCDVQTTGICHCADIDLVWGLPVLYPSAYNLIDTMFSNYILDVWTNFAKYGNTNNTIWPKFIDSNNVSHIKDMNPNSLSTIFTNLYEFKCDTFWKPYFVFP